MRNSCYCRLERMLGMLGMGIGVQAGGNRSIWESNCWKCCGNGSVVNVGDGV